MAGLRLCAASGSPRASRRSFSACDFPFQLGVGKRSLHYQQQFFALEGLLQIIERAIAHRQHGAFHRPEGGEEYDGKSRMRFMQPRKNLFSRHAGHAHIQQNQVGRVDEAFCECFRGVNEDIDRRTGQSQHPLDILAQRSLVVDDQNPAHSVVPPANQWYGWPRVNRAGGNSITKLAPPPFLGS